MLADSPGEQHRLYLIVGGLTFGYDLEFGGRKAVGVAVLYGHWAIGSVLFALRGIVAGGLIGYIAGR